MASYGQVDVDYLVSQVDKIAEGDTSNIVEALKNDRKTSIAKLREAAAECTNTVQWRHKARFGIAALGLGDTVLPIDICEFEERTDHGLRSVFIDEFPRWELEGEELIETVNKASNPALRSAVCLGLGGRPSLQISAEEKKQVSDAAEKWFFATR